MKRPLNWLRKLTLIKPEAVINSIKLFPYLLKAHNYVTTSIPMIRHDFRYLEKRVVDRESFLESITQGKRVLHFGFLDIPFLEEKINSGVLLHTKIKKVAAFLYGIDVNESGLEQYRQLTGDFDNAIFDITQPVNNYLEFISGSYDIILFTEVLEHLQNPFTALKHLREVCELNPGAQLCVTVPNALSIFYFYSALQGIEQVHPDHYYYFSPYTLNRLMHDAGFSSVDLWLYIISPFAASPGLIKQGVIAIGKP